MITLKNLAIQGFKSYKEDQVLDFALNSLFTFISGKNEEEPDLGANGTGKSGLWDALCWVFFGKTVRGVRGPSVVNWDGQSHTSVFIEFSIGKDYYSLTRAVNPNALVLTKNESDPKPITQEQIEDLIGISYQGFVSSVVIGQMTRTFFDLSPAEKLSSFTATLNLEKWVKSSELAKKLAKDSDSARQKLEKDLSAKKALLEDTQHRVSSAVKNSENFEKSRQLEIDDLSLIISQKEQEFNLLNAKLCEANTKGGVLGSSKESLCAALSPYLDKAERLKGEIGATREKLLSQEGELKLFQTEKSRILGFSDKGTCPVCKQSIDSNHIRDEMARLDQNIERVNSLLKDSSDSTVVLREELSTVLESIKLKDRDLVKIEQDLEILAREITVLSKNLSSIETEISLRKKSIDGLRAKENLYAVELRVLQETIKNLSSSIGVLQTELTETLIRLEEELFWSEHFKLIRLWLIEEAVAELEIHVNSTLTQLGLVDWKVSFDVERENSSGGVTKGFAVFIKSPKNDDPASWESWSGGETQRLRIAGAVGFASLIASRTGFNCSIEVWDEPSAHLSEEGISSLLEFLQVRSRTQRKEVFLVDHRTLNSGLFDREIRIVRKPNQGSQIVKVV